jgi:hypothetical protein
VAVIETGLDEDAPCTDRFRVFGDERALLGGNDAGQAQEDCENREYSYHD